MPTTNIHTYIQDDDYYAVDLAIITATNHLTVQVTINGHEGLFILDTGASQCCIDKKVAERWELLTPSDKQISAAGVGTSDMVSTATIISHMQLANWETSDLMVAIIDLSHVNVALGVGTENAIQIDGIIGADVLLNGKALINYATKMLYLKPIAKSLNDEDIPATNE